MSGNRQKVYWDSCVFYALLKNERHQAGELEGIKEQVKRIEKNQLILVTSAITAIEVLEAKLPEEVREGFPNLFKRRNVRAIPSDMKVVKLSTEIRNYYIENPSDKIGFTVSLPDAIHLATAILYADVFHTMDSNDKNKSKELGLLPLNGLIAGKYNLKICRPPKSNQYELDF